MQNRYAFGVALSAIAIAQAHPAAAQAVQGVPTVAGSNATTAPNAGVAANASGNSPALGDIVVTARRQNESLSRVPVAVSVVSAERISTTGTFRPEDIQQLVPSVTLASGAENDRNSQNVTIRGQGTVYGALFPSVIPYFAEVPIRNLSVGQFFDIEGIQVLRGPQGVQFGRVTNGGNVMLAPKRPTDTYSGDVTLKAGDYGLIGTTGAANVPIAGDKLMVRFAWDVAHRDGFTRNDFNGRELDNVNYKTVRLGVLWKPTDSFENYTVAQYQDLRDNGTGLIYAGQRADSATLGVSSLFPLVTSAADFGFGSPVYGIDSVGRVKPFAPGLTPLNVPNYVAALQSQVAAQRGRGIRNVFATYPTFTHNKTLYVVNSTTINVSDNLTIKNIFGYTKNKQKSAQNFVGDNSGYVQPCHSACPFPGGDVPYINQEQLSNELRMSGTMFDNRLNWSIGGYADVQRPAGPNENATVLFGIFERDQIQFAKTTSKAAYGYAEFEVLDGLKLNGGVRYTHDTVRSDNAVYIKFIDAPGLLEALSFTLGPDLAAATLNGVVPHGKCEDYAAGIFSSTCQRFKASFNAFTWTVGASYQLTPSHFAYAKVSRGYRPGGVNSTSPTPETAQYGQERDTSIELGFKSKWMLGQVPIRTSIAIFHDNYKGIQQLVSALDPVTNATDSFLSNSADATIKGLEFESSIQPLPGLTIGANYSYVDAEFKKSNFNPADCDPNNPLLLGFCPLSRFSNTPKHQVSIQAHWDFIRDSDVGTIGVGGNFYHQSSAAIGTTANSAFSPSTIEPAYSTLNLDATWKGIMGEDLDLTVFVTNVTNKTYRSGTNSIEFLGGIGNLTNIYSPPRMWGASLTAHFR